MNLTTEELIKLVEEHDSKAAELEKDIVRYTGMNHSKLEEYNTSNILVLLGLINLDQVTIDEVFEQCLNQLHK